MSDYSLVLHRGRAPLLTEFAGPGGLLGSIKSRIELGGPDYVVRDAARVERFLATRRTALALRVEVDGKEGRCATLHGSMFPLVNPRARIEGIDALPWAVWKSLATGIVEFRMDGREVLRMEAGIVSRGWRTSTEARAVFLDTDVEPLLALTMAALAVECL